MADLKLSILDSNSNISYEYNEVSAIETPDMGIPEALNEKYIYINKLGKGSQGQVWLAQRKSDGERVAIKQLNVHSVTTWKQYELFKREARILESLNIDGVVPFYEYIEDLEAKPPFVCIIQKFIEGQTLGEMLKAKHRFETEAIYDIIAQVLGILQKLHTHEPPVVHRDIKPSNLMLTPLENGRYKVTLLDFGAVANPQVQNGGSTVAGTYGYMPPEQLMGQAQPASDIYALAALAVEMLSGTLPADIAVCDFKLVIEPYLQHLPKEVVQTLSMMLEPAVENRICDHTALMAQFDALANKKEPSLLRFLRRTAVPKLEDVESICQPGNYEIWQHLDQSTEIDLENCPCHLDIKSSQGDMNTSKLFGSHSAVWIVLISVFFLSLMTLLMMTGAITEFVVLAVLAPVLSCFFAYWKQAGSSSRIELRDTPLKDISHLSWEEIHKVLSGGQKVVGQISAIYYQNIDEQYDLLFTQDLKQKDVIAFDFPKFWVIYHFKHQGEFPFEFYGSFLSYTPPEGHYKVGDPITLVVNISPTNKGMMRLSVVPYPYPFGDVFRQDEILYTCDIEQTYLQSGDIWACEKQLKLHCLSSLQFTHHSLGGDSPSSLFASKYGPISNAEQDHAIFHSVNLEHQNIAFAETSTRKVEVYPHRYLDFESSCVFYRLLAEQYLKRFEFTAEELVSRASYVDKAACIYKTMLNDEETARELYWQLADKYIDEYVAGNDEYFKIAEELYQEKLYVKSPSCVDMEKTTDYRFYASIVDRLIPKVSMGEYRYIKVLDVIYRDYLKFSHEADKIRKMQRLLELSEKGNADACMELGNIYRDVFFNEALSNVFYHRAADQYLKNYKRDDDVDACLDAAALFEKLLGKEISSVFYQRAVEIHLEYFKQYDDVDACLDAAAIYKKNLGDEEAARKLYEKAVDYHLKKFKRYHIRQSCLDAVNIYKKYLGDDEAANNLYYELIVLDLKQFQKSGDMHVLQRAENLYVCELKNKKSRCETHEKIANICIELLDLMNDEIIQFLLEIADVLKNKFLNTEAAFNLYRKLADAYIERFAFTDDSFYIHRAIKIYKDKLPESMEIDVLYRKLADSYIKKFECSGDFMFIHSAVNIYKNKLSDERGMQETYKKMLNYCMQKFDETGDEEFIHKVMPICRLIIKDFNVERDLWLKLIGLRLKSGDEASMMDAAKIYRFHLKDVDSANQIYKQIIDKLLSQAHSDDEVVLKAAEIYKNNLNDRSSAERLLRSLVEKYLKLYESGSIEALEKAADICRKKLYDVSLTRKLYTQLAEQYLKDWDEGDIEALEKAAKIYRDILFERNSAHKLYTQLAEQYLNDWKQSKRKFSKENENIEALVKAAEIYKTDLKDPDTAAELYQLLETGR